METNRAANPPIQGERATDTDREHTADVLADAYARGALNAVEHEQRLSRALAARHLRELTALISDLPAASEVDMVSSQRATDMAQWLQEWRWWVGGAVIMSAVWGVRALATGPGFFWPVVPLGIWAAILIAVAIWPRDDE